MTIPQEEGSVLRSIYMRFKKQSVSSSVGINVVPPKDFAVSGDTKVKPTVVEQKLTADEALLEFLYRQLEQTEKQRQELINMIEQVRGRVGCSGCEKKKP